MEDITGAIEANYPDRLAHKVHFRAAECHVQLRNLDLAYKEVGIAQALLKDTSTAPDKTRM